MSEIGKQKKAKYSKAEKLLLSKIHIDSSVKKILYISDDSITDHNFKKLIQEIVSKPSKPAFVESYFSTILESQGIDPEGYDIGTKKSTNPFLSDKPILYVLIFDFN